MIAIIDYGLGNIRAFANVYKKMNIPIIIATTVDDLKNASRVILPGVGAFDQAMKKLNGSGLRQYLEEIVLYRHVPLLGVCVGMQILARSSEEGSLSGLGWIDGEVRKLKPGTTMNSSILPHMGWNDIHPVIINPLFQGIDRGARFYFLHSYYFHCQKKDNVLAVTNYGGEFASAVNSGNIFGVQFHPEKSHQYGIRLLENFTKV